MGKNYLKATCKALLTAFACLVTSGLDARTVVDVKTPGTLSSLIKTSDSELKVTGKINGTDIKFIRNMVVAGTVTSLDWSEVSIVKGGNPYFGSFYSEDNTIGEALFNECSKLQKMILPSNIIEIKKEAFARSGLKEIDIPNSVMLLDFDCFAYCNDLAKVVIGKNVSHLNQGVFWYSGVQDVYVKPTMPPTTVIYTFSSRPRIHVYTDAVDDYIGSSWSEFGDIYDGLEKIYPQEKEEDKEINFGNYFKDEACTELKAEYQSMSDADLTATLTDAKIPEVLINAALKVKNDSWAKYEKDFRVHKYKAYSDANYWNNKMMATGGSYMGNPTGIYAKNLGEEIYVFVDSDIPADATLYIAGCVENALISSPNAGQKLQKGINVIKGSRDAIYYILYVADTKSMTRKITDWPEIKIHIEGGTVNGYFDLSRHTDSDYQAILRGATLKRFTVKGEHSLYHFKTSTFREVFPYSITKSISYFDNLATWEKELMGMCESVTSGQRAGYPWYLTGGEAIYPCYYNNPNFAIEGEESDAGYANSSPYRISYNSVGAIRNDLDPTNPQMGDWGPAHETGHNNQGAINLEGCTEASNNLFSNVVAYLGGINSTRGSNLSFVMEEYAHHIPFYFRDLGSRMRIFFNLYLYYHLAQKNTSFYPELFKALREDPIKVYNPSDNNEGGLKFVRKVCDVAQEDLTDFFTIWGFFEPIEPTTIDDYGTHPIAVTEADIAATKAYIAKYPKKNREIIFIEDRVTIVPSTGFLQSKDFIRNDPDNLGKCADLGQFTDYLPNACQPGWYTYLKADNIYSMTGSGGIGFFMLDSNDNIRYAANTTNVIIPESVDSDFTIYSCDPDGKLTEVTKGGEGLQRVDTPMPGRLANELTEEALKAVITGKINGTDIKHLRNLLTKGNLLAIDISDAEIVNGGQAYFENYSTSSDATGDYTFEGHLNLNSIILPKSLKKIGFKSFSNTGLKSIEIPNLVHTVAMDAFAYNKSLTEVTIGESVNEMGQGVFWYSPVKDVYVKPMTPPTIGIYFFSSNPTIHVYKSAVAKYKASPWAQFGTIVGDLDDIMAGVDNPVVDDVNDKQEVYYDLYGRRVTNLQSNTIYISNGKKIIIK
ncbi:MAG: leucine-rich repeat protein [Muribaculaceae bacterium]|nr:leucine-rich repeat protein [Muribaculaceae bacterium]